MNFLKHSFVLFVTLFSIAAVFAACISFDKSDFASAKEDKQNGEIIVLANLSKTGASKVKDLNKTSVGKEIEIHVAGETHSLKLREPIKGNEMQFGPFSKDVAQKIVSEVNSQKWSRRRRLRSASLSLCAGRQQFVSAKSDYGDK